MTIVNTNMLRHEKTPVDNILKALSWDDIPEEYRDDCRDIAVRAALALLRQFERAHEHGQTLLFPELYTPVGVEIGFTMTQRYIAVGKSVLFRDAIDKIIVAFVNHDYLDVSLSNLHPGNLLYSLSERGLDFLQRALMTKSVKFYRIFSIPLLARICSICRITIRDCWLKLMCAILLLLPYRLFRCI